VAWAVCTGQWWGTDRGIIDNYGRGLFPELSYFTLFVPMTIVLALRPTGLLERIKERMIAKPMKSRRVTWWLLAGILVLLLLPPFYPKIFVIVLTQALIFGIVAMILIS